MDESSDQVTAEDLQRQFGGPKKEGKVIDFSKHLQELMLDMLKVADKDEELGESKATRECIRANNCQWTPQEVMENLAWIKDRKERMKREPPTLIGLEVNDEGDLSVKFSPPLNLPPYMIAQLDQL